MAAIVNVAPMSDLLPILDIDGVSCTRVQEGQRRGAATFCSSVWILTKIWKCKTQDSSCLSSLSSEIQHEPGVMENTQIALLSTHYLYTIYITYTLSIHYLNTIYTVSIHYRLTVLASPPTAPWIRWAAPCRWTQCSCPHTHRLLNPATQQSSS